MNKSDFIIVYEGDYSGLETKSGDTVLPCRYDKILDYDDDGYIRFIKSGIYGTIDLKGNVCIPLTKKLSHLGVFYKGTARARIDDMWGLVDVHGTPVTEFVYKSIQAHRKNGYRAVTAEDKQGWLSEDGKFEVSSRQPKARPLYSFIGAYRNHVAPAVARNGKWVFIDEDRNRINDMEYTAMDHVLRHGVYSVAKGQNAYGIANFEGVPLTDDWYDHPCKFDMGFAVCDIRRRDENGKDITLPNGQPAYHYGVINLKGEYVFPPVYSSLHWNDYKSKDCWFAEDEKQAYLLFPDGTNKTYAKSQIADDSFLDYIPESAFNHDIQAHDSASYNPIRLSAVLQCSLFEEKRFVMHLSPWIGKWTDSLTFYYRDTDADIDIRKLYKPGHFVRTDCALKVSRKLLRPVHKIRFLIAARRLVETDETQRTQNLNNRPLSQPRDCMIPANMNFLIVDVQKFAGTTQIVLLHFPHGAILLARQLKIKPAKLKSLCNGVHLKEDAKDDLMQKMGECVHGHSLDADWCNAMYRPVGCNARLKPNKPVMEPYPCSDYDESHGFSALRSLQDYDEEWREGRFLTAQSGTVRIYSGGFTGHAADVMICPEKKGPDCMGNRLREGMQERQVTEPGNAPDPISVTKTYNQPYQQTIHVWLPEEEPNSSEALRILKKGMDNAMKEAERLEAGMILFPAMAFEGHDEIRTTVEVFTDHLVKKEYKGSLKIFTRTEEAAEAFRSCFETFGNRYPFSIHEELH